jgi:hypothetical protein
MNFAAMADSGFKQKPMITLIYSEPGLGKTTFASKWPAVAMVDLELGSLNLDVTRFTADKLPDYKTLLAFVDWLQEGNHQFKSVALDSVTVIESYLQKHVCGSKYSSVEDLPYGKGYTMVREEAQVLMQKLRKLSNTMNVLLIAHAMKKQFADPISNTTWTRYVLQCDEKLAQILTSGSDNVFFITQNVTTAIDERTKKTLAYSTGERKLMCEWRSSFDAKNRINLAAEMPLDYDAFIKAVEAAKPKSADELLADIKAMASKADEATTLLIKSKVKEAAGDAEKLMRIKQKLSTMVST